MINPFDDIFSGHRAAAKAAKEAVSAAEQREREKTAELQDLGARIRASVAHARSTGAGTAPEELSDSFTAEHVLIFRQFLESATRNNYMGVEAQVGSTHPLWKGRAYAFGIAHLPVYEKVIDLRSRYEVERQTSGIIALCDDGRLRIGPPQENESYQSHLRLKMTDVGSRRHPKYVTVLDFGAVPLKTKIFPGIQAPYKRDPSSTYYIQQGSMPESPPDYVFEHTDLATALLRSVYVN